MWDVDDLHGQRESLGREGDVDDDSSNNSIEDGKDHDGFYQVDGRMF